jgi:metal transporter CNNM
VVLANSAGDPLLLFDADGALRAALMDLDKPFDIYDYCRRPLFIMDDNKMLAEVISYLKSISSNRKTGDGAIDYDAVLITGADILGKLLKEIRRIDRLQSLLVVNFRYFDFNFKSSLPV